MKVVIRWRVVHPAEEGPKISCRSYVMFEEIVDGHRDRIRSCPINVWPSMRAKIAENDVTFEQVPDIREPTLPDLSKPKIPKR
jgi:hypothetical protein